MGKTIFRSAKLNKNKRAGVIYFALMFAVLCWLSFKAYVMGEWDTKAMLIYAAVMFVFPILSGIPQMVVWWGSGTESQAAGSLFGALFPLALFDVALLGIAFEPLSAE